MRRHRWVKLRTHVYVCRVCGAGRVNSWDDFLGWIATWHRSDGGTDVGTKTPPCEYGVRTDAALGKYAVEIAEAVGEKVELQ